ncbi:MAG TPA: type IV toxin-antitoxin system AbiEi family antitoxin domain-containing protein [Bdellovibrionota bacterium]|nr:type IV toxin-antitoxin system AbiEi family antitoxin domain-containing protein [Bdellovibrionota bacterium]
MDRLKGNKLNQLLQKWPPGAVAPTRWLSTRGISKQLLDRYEEYNWITRIAKGVVMRTGDVLTWQGIVFSLETLQGLPVWVGGKSALQLKGLMHYLSMKEIPIVSLYSSTQHRLPKWVFEQEKVARFQFQQTKLFSDKVSHIGFTTIDMEKLKITLSSPERAILELLEGVPQKQTFEEAKLIFENLTTLRANMVQSLLEQCTSIKAKRLFLYFAEECGHSWFSKLNPSKIDLGKGKRAIVSEGCLNTKYQILVPRAA